MAGLGTRFLPLSKVLPKELWPLVDKPIIQYIIEELKASGIKDIVFIRQPKSSESAYDYLGKYFKKIVELERTLKARGKEKILEEMKNLEEIFRKSSFSYAIQKSPLGDGHAILQAEKIMKDEPFAVSMADDVVESETPCILQMAKVYEKIQRPILALHKLPKEKLSFYGIVDAEPIIIPGLEASKIYKIKKIIEKPSAEEAPSDLAIVGKYILTPDIFSQLKKSQKNKSGEIILSEALQKMIEDGKEIYGCEFEGKWLECGNKSAYLESNFYLSLKHPEFGPKLKKFIENL